MGGKITENTLDEIRSKIDIVELIGARVTLKRSGNSYKGCCPFHNEKTPSFHVIPDKQFFHCFGCGISGDVFSFLMKQDGLRFIDAVRQLAEKAGVSLEIREDDRAQARKLLLKLHLELAEYYQRSLAQDKEAGIARDYLAKRGLGSDISARFGIGYAPARPRNAVQQWARKHGYSNTLLEAAGILGQGRRAELYDRFAGRLIFPICNHTGNVVAFSARLLRESPRAAKYVNSPETEIFSKSRVLYGLDKAARQITRHPHREAIVCEGQIDVIRCHDCGFDNAVAGQGTALTIEHVKRLKRFSDCAVLAFDGDEAGKKAAVRAGALFLSEEIPVRVAVLPAGADPDSLLSREPHSVFQKLINDAVSITNFQIKSFKESEAQPNSIDALSRLARGVLEVLAICPGAVLRARLLQEAADLLRLPVSALESDLEKHMDATRQSAGRRGVARTTEVQSGEPVPTAIREVASVEDGTAGVDGGCDAPVSMDSGRAPVMPGVERAVCELLVEHEGDIEVLETIREFLPEYMFTHHLTKELIQTAAQQLESGDDLLAGLLASVEAGSRSLLEDILTHKRKMLGAKEIDRIEAARDLVVRIWVNTLKQRRSALGNSDGEEVDIARLNLTTTIKRLETLPWEGVCQLIKAQIAEKSQGSGVAEMSG